MSDPLWTPTDIRSASSNLIKFYQFIENKYDASFQNDYGSLWNWSVKENSKFWPSLLEYLNIEYSGNILPTVTNETDIYDQKYFPNIDINYAQNILNKLNDVPIVFRNETGFRIEIGKDEIYEKVNKLCSYLRSIGIKKGDRVAAVAANTPDTIISFLATNCLGAIWSSCSPDFGENAILDRFNQIHPKILLYSEIYLYGGKKINIKEKIKAVFGKIKSAKLLIRINYPDSSQEDSSEIKDLNSIYDGEIKTKEIKYEICKFNDPMYILYSSGTTGKPKCIVHNTGGPLIQHMKEQQLHCDLKKDNKIFYFTTCGWMMWNWLISSVASQATIILYDGSPFFPEKDSLIKIADTEALDIFGISAKYIDALRNENIQITNRFKLQNLKCILSTGSPLSSDGFEYVYNSIKKDVHLASISGGTDIVSCFVAGNSMLPVYAGEIQCKCLGINVDIFDSKEASTNEKGELVCKSSMPSMPIGFWNDDNNLKYKKSYFSQYSNIWSQGDYAQFTKNNGIIIYGRSDATLNPGGIRIGTAEIYRVVEEINAIEESIAVGQYWENDTRIILFIKLRTQYQMSKDLEIEISNNIKEKLSRRHVPSHIIQVSDIPKTRSGKIAELTVRDTINGEPIKNIEALANPECLSQYQDIAEIKK
ncbi:acetoacetate--CoA ligase [Pelagibacterales bacterium]|nr:acetoacetate--CoA ligase [Pelagibacterales bacterium]|tara:strand:+ start:433 stop:2379 length:1947 start_codon:yes stop_codon:yes gene_type:complete